MSGFRVRIHVKRDSESAIGRGGVLTGAHFRPEIARIIWAACQTKHSIQEIWITEGWRPPRDGRRDLHPELRALDIVCYRGGAALGEAEHQLIAIGMVELLGHDYQVIAHDTGSGVHIHAELDPK
jgi:hypothetical protein